MTDPVRELKIRAQILHRAVQALEPSALGRLRALPELRAADGDRLRSAAAAIQRKHCLAAVARESGFGSWEHALRVLEGDEREGDHGTLLYGRECHGHLSPWFASYDEAREALAASSSPPARGYLLAYKRQFFLADRHLVASLGLDADDPDWGAIGWDWPRPKSREARRRLYGKRLAAQRAHVG